MIVVLPVILGGAAGLLAGGRLANWMDVSLRWPWLVVAALLVRVVVVLPPLNRVDDLRFVYVAFLLVLVGWTLAHVDRLPGVWLVSLGAAMNLVVIVANGARMPVAAAGAGHLATVGHIGQYVVMDSGTRLGWMADWIIVPGWLGGVYSPGDVVVAVGIGIVSFFVTRRKSPSTKLDATSGRIGS